MTKIWLQFTQVGIQSVQQSGFWRESERRVKENGDGWRGSGLSLGLRLIRSCDPPVRSREENSDTDRDSDSAPPSTGWSWWITKECWNSHQTRPRMGLYRDGATLYRCTPTKTADHTLPPPQYTQAERSTFHLNPSRKSLQRWCHTEDYWSQSSTVVSACYDLQKMLLVSEQLCTFALWSCPFAFAIVVCREGGKVGGLCFFWAPCFGFTCPRSSTPPSTHSRPIERFSAASAFQIKHSNRKRTPPPFNKSITHSLTKAFFCGLIDQAGKWCSSGGCIPKRCTNVTSTHHVRNKKADFRESMGSRDPRNLHFKTYHDKDANEKLNASNSKMGRGKRHNWISSHHKLTMY